MNLKKLRQNSYMRLRLWPIARRRTVEGVELPRIDDDWLLDPISDGDVVVLRNQRTDHIAKIGADRIHHFDREPHRDWDGLRHGLLELRVQLLLSGSSVHFLHMPGFRPMPHRRRA